MAKKRGRKNVRRGPYRYTTKRKAALTRAQAISARKRKGHRNSAIKGAVIGASLAGVGAAAIYGYKNRSTIRDTQNSWKNAVQPGSKERTRIGNAISGILTGRRVLEGSSRPYTKAALDAAQQAKNIKQAKAANKPKKVIAAADPNSVDPTRNNAFPRAQNDVLVVNKLIEGSDRPYNIDKFIPRGVKRLMFGKQVTGNAASKAVKTHADAKGAITKKEVDASGILHNMIDDGTVTKIYAGKRIKNPKLKPPILPKNSRAGVTKKPRAKQTLESKAFEQWIKDFD